MAVFAENGSFRPKNCYGRNFGYGRISAFLKLSLTVSVFRKKFPFGHTLYSTPVTNNNKMFPPRSQLKFPALFSYRPSGCCAPAPVRRPSATSNRLPSASPTSSSTRQRAAPTGNNLIWYNQYYSGYLIICRMPNQQAKKPLEKTLEISYTGKSTKMGNLDQIKTSLHMSQNHISISSGFSSGILAY